MLPANSISTTFRQQMERPVYMSFGWTAARDGNQVRFLPAVQLALPARPWPVIDGGLNSFLDVPLPHSGNGGGVDQKHTGYLPVPKSFICFEQRQRPLDGADRLAPVGNPWRRERSDSVSGHSLQKDHTQV